MHFPSTFAFYYLIAVFVIWLFHELHIEKNRNTNLEQLPKSLKANNAALVIGSTTSLLLMLSLLAVNVFVAPWFLYPIAWLSYIGSTMALFGIYLRWYAIRTLSDHFDANIQIKENQELIQHGLFSHIRHPSYTGSLLTFTGFGIASLNAISAIVLPSFLLIIYAQRIRLEEEVLLKGFGQKYVDYRKSTGALFPATSLFKKNR